jgi:two-component system OmpR family sensor kinase
MSEDGRGERGERLSTPRGPLARAAAVLARLDLRDRVTLATAAVLAGGLVLLTAGAMALLDAQLDKDVSSTLQERADAQLVTVDDVGGRTVVGRPGDGTLDEQTWVFDRSGRVLRRPPAPAAVQRAARELVGVTHATDRNVGDNVRLRAEPATAPDGRRIGTVVVGVSLDPYDRTEHLALLALLALDACIVAFGALLARRAVGKALRPVADMTAQASEWSEHDLDRRFDLGPPRDELTALSATLDALLARIASSLRREQRFSAEMAHELRTPLSGVRGEAELALRTAGTPPDVRAALEQILRGTDRMQGVIDALLSAARGESGNGSVSDAYDVARAALDAAAPAAERAGVRLTLVRGPGEADDGRDQGGRPLTVGADARLVVQALAPLLDNAIRHADHAVALRVERAGGALLLHVEDDGEGIPASEVETIFAPGASGSGGAGLGLPLARRLARSCGGDVTAVPADGGHVVLRLPLV